VTEEINWCVIEPSDELGTMSGIGTIAHLRRTIGDRQWLDTLDNEQWRVLLDEIMPVFYRAWSARPGARVPVTGEG